MTDASQIPPGWYADPQNPGTQRWWNGLDWTDDRRPATDAAAAPAAPAAPGAPAYPSYPAYQSYPAAAPVAPVERRDIPTNTPWIWLVVLLPLLTVVPMFFVDWAGIVEESMRTALENTNPLAPVMFPIDGLTLLFTGLSYAVVAAQVLFAWLDWRALKARGIDRPFHWAWIFFAVVITNGVYVIGRGIVLRRQTGKGLAPVWAWIAVTVLTIISVVVVTSVLLSAILELMPTFEEYMNR